MIYRQTVQNIPIPMTESDLVVTVTIEKDTGSPIVIPSSQISTGSSPGWYIYTTTVDDTTANTLSITASASGVPNYYVVYDLALSTDPDSTLAATVADLSTILGNLTSEQSAETPGLGLPFESEESHFSYEEPVLTFTTRYSVLYAQPSQLRMILGHVIKDDSDDMLLYHLFIASVETNILLWEDALPVEQAIRPLYFRHMTSEVPRIAMAIATVSLLTKHIGELSMMGVVTNKLGDFEYTRQYNVGLSEMQLLLDEARAIVNSATKGRNSVRDAGLGAQRHMNPIVRRDFRDPRKPIFTGPAGTPAGDNLFDPEM